MGWLLKFLGAASKTDLDGLQLNSEYGFWTVQSTRELPVLLRALHHIADENAVLYLEDGGLDGELNAFMKRNAFRGTEKIALGTIWPKPTAYHIKASAEVLCRLSELSEHISPFELATHLHVYEPGRVILEWYDAFTVGMRLSRHLPEEKVRGFADELGVTFAFQKAVE